jgi:Meiotically up-regulated gene 113
MATRSQIVEEIKRTAKVNGGIPLGHRAFESETGIKYHDWFGIHWARWGDAVREAGFTPNELRGAFDGSDVLERYASLAHELGYLPTKGEIRIKKRADPSFPNDKVFDRFGAKRKLIEQVLTYCRSGGVYEDVAQACEEHLRSQEETKVEEIVPLKDVEIGFVYLIRSGKFYKIGRSNAAGRREREIALQLPDKASTIHTIRTDDPNGIEAYWHQRFQTKRKNGEWFELNPQDVSAFKRRKFM